MGNFLIALRVTPLLADRFMEQLTNLYLECANRYLDQVSPFLPVFTYWDDVAGQNSLLISREHCRQQIKPKQRRLVEATRKKTRAKLFYHGCGAMYNLIPDLIEVGFDILNPVRSGIAMLSLKGVR